MIYNSVEIPLNVLRPQVICCFQIPSLYLISFFLRDGVGWGKGFCIWYYLGNSQSHLALPLILSMSRMTANQPGK